MYDYLAGKLVEKKPSYVIVDLGGAGFRAEIPLSTFEALPAAGVVKLFTHVKVGEDEIKIYGFATQNEREVFRMLINSVTGMGASKALSLLSHMNIEELVHCIEGNDALRLKRIKGVGEKLAQRIIVEMKGKITYVYEKGGAGAPSTLSESRDAVKALISLGYQVEDAERAVEKAVKECGGNAELEEIIKRALQVL